MPKPESWLDHLTLHHIRSAGAHLVTVCASPLGVSSYVVAGGEDASVESVRLEHGTVITRQETSAFGTLISVVGGPSVVEVALHADEEQRDRYRGTVAAVDAENREQALTAVQAMAVSMLTELGVTVDDDQEQGDVE